MLSFSYMWVFVLLPLPFVLRLVVKPYQEEKSALQVPFFDELVTLSGQKPGTETVVIRQTMFHQVVMLLCWVLLLAALARPQWIERPVVKEIPTRDLLLAVDLSSSMQAEDFTTKGGKRSNRLTAVKEVLDDFLTRRQGDRAGLIFFGSAPFLQAPFTEDLELCRELLAEAQVGMAGPKTALGDTIGLAITLFKESKVQDKLLILLTDGNDTSSKVAPVDGAAIAKDNGIVVYTVAVGDPQSVGEEKLDEQTLKQVAQVTGGYFFRASDQEQLKEIYQKIDTLSTHTVETSSYRPRQDIYHLPLAGAIGMVLLLQAATAFNTFSTKRGG